MVKIDENAASEGKKEEKSVDTIINTLQTSESRVIKALNANQLFFWCEDAGLRAQILKRSTELAMIAYNEYQPGGSIVAEKIFEMLATYDESDFEARNNYAFMLRRGETEQKKHGLAVKALKLLRDGVVVNHDAFSCVNMALTFSMLVGEEEDWVTANRIVAEFISGADMRMILSWWNTDKLNKEGDQTECDLVRLFLIRNGKAAATPNDITVLYGRVKRGIPTIPEWMAKVAD